MEACILSGCMRVLRIQMTMISSGLTELPIRCVPNGLWSCREHPTSGGFSLWKSSLHLVTMLENLHLLWKKSVSSSLVFFFEDIYRLHFSTEKIRVDSSTFSVSLFVVCSITLVLSRWHGCLALPFSCPAVSLSWLQCFTPDVTIFPFYFWDRTVVIIPPQCVLLMMTRVISANLVKWEVTSVIFSFPGNVCGDLALGGP